MTKKWIALSSQTGSEILNISRRIEYFPDILITNNNLENLNEDLFKYYRDSDDKLLLKVDVKFKSKHYDEIFSEFKTPIITLNGWLKIVPPDICDKYKIYNGHPALISEFPELKGKDPVQRVWADRTYKKFGSVIHLVTAEVDEGKILMEDSQDFNFDTFEEFDTAQRKLSLELWINFLKKYIK
ncbi:MAG: formyltransferase family protein [Minisyncoccia bacterium]